MLVYLFNINITITKVCVLFVFCTYLNIVINYKVISKWNQPIIIVMDNSYCVIGDIYEKIRIFQKINRTTSDKYAIICSEFGCNISFEDNVF